MYHIHELGRLTRVEFMHRKPLTMRVRTRDYKSAKSVFARTQKPTRETRALPRPETYSLHIRIRAFAIFGDEAVDARRDNSESIREQAAAALSRARARYRETSRGAQLQRVFTRCIQNDGGRQ
jgi:hypothetical protein